MMNINKKNYTIVAEQLINELKDNITGNNEEWLFGKKPSEHVMIGMIDGGFQGEESFLKGISQTTDRRETIPSLGLRVRLKKEANEISIRLQGKLFYRVKSSFENQTKFLLERYTKKTGINFTKRDDLIKYIEDCKSNQDYVEPKEGIVYIHKSINLADFGEFILNIDNFENSIKDINFYLSEIISKKIDEIRTMSVGYKRILRPVTSLLNEDKYNKIEDSAVSNVVPNWKIELYSTKEIYEKYNEIVLQLINITEKNNDSNSFETSIFNGGLSLKSETGFLPIPLNSLKHYYLDNPTLPGIGNNCSVNKVSEFELATENIPMYVQNRIVTIDKFDKYIEFYELINNPIDNLKFIRDEMNKKLRLYKIELEEAKKNSFPKKYIKGFEKEISDFEHEINRFNNGINLINNKSDVKNSFALMNETFGEKKKYKGWRMFQIVFIVSEIADMINCEYEKTPGFNQNYSDIDKVDLIYFPTGGGKTEAFLGCCIFSAFFDRVRGKENGVTAIIKYPLRLLAAQQLERVLSLTIDANNIKKKYNIEGDDFSVGFFTGSKNTPNDIDEKKRIEIETYPQETRDSLYRQIDFCPKCNSEMHVFFDSDRWVLEHRCSNYKCNYLPPIYIVDDEIYRFTPSFVISTIDKMANIGTSMGFKSLLGQSSCKCPKHGFSKYGDKCYVNKCNIEIEKNIERKDPVPTLSIQDEMHLVNESLGTFDSHYESLIQYYCENLISSNYRKKIKFIGATATISEYKAHIKGLYNKAAKKFPSTVKKENFYSKVDENDVNRFILGCALYGGSITESIQKMVTFLRVIISNWLNNLSEKIYELNMIGFDSDEDGLKEILHNYLISIVYNNSKSDAGTIRANLENIGSNYLLSENLPNFEIAEITGDIEFKTIKDVMHDVESDNNKYKTKNIIIATSAISHGVDEDCFNQIFFFGMPKQTSEYIQAYSRVGRKYTGIVFDVFRIIRDRDKSYLKNFYNFHEYKDLLVNPVPINRYAKNAIYSTLPGIFAALMYQHYVKKQTAIEVTKLINAGKLNVDTIINDIKNIYDCSNQDSKLYEEIIEIEVKKIFNAFKTNTNTEKKISELIKNANSYHKGPMTNLRDVDIPLEVKLKGE